MPKTRRIMIDPSPRRAVQNLNTFHAIVVPDLCIVFKPNHEKKSNLFRFLEKREKKKEETFLGKNEFDDGTNVSERLQMQNSSRKTKPPT